MRSEGDVIRDYRKIYREARHFGIRTEQGADANGARDALTILAETVDRSRDQDIRHDGETGDALDWLAEQAGGAQSVAAFRQALAIPHPVTRRQALADAYKRLCRTAQGRQAVTRD